VGCGEAARLETTFSPGERHRPPEQAKAGPPAFLAHPPPVADYGDEYLRADTGGHTLNVPGVQRQRPLRMSQGPMRQRTGPRAKSIPDSQTPLKGTESGPLRTSTEDESFVAAQCPAS
jgi:hypothetical protein